MDTLLCFLKGIATLLALILLAPFMILACILMLLGYSCIAFGNAIFDAKDILFDYIELDKL